MVQGAKIIGAGISKRVFVALVVAITIFPLRYISFILDIRFSYLAILVITCVFGLFLRSLFLEKPLPSRIEIAFILLLSLVFSSIISCYIAHINILIISIYGCIPELFEFFFFIWRVKVEMVTNVDPSIGFLMEQPNVPGSNNGQPGSSQAGSNTSNPNPNQPSNSQAPVNVASTLTKLRDDNFILRSKANHILRDLKTNELYRDSSHFLMRTVQLGMVCNEKLVVCRRIDYYSGNTFATDRHNSTQAVKWVKH